ncbi:TIGR03767 family metallophosphoesterase, partial [Streptomyces sp. AC536]|nr:TIGR03767 family metallophosphoesterase [Streptomyces buecherae]
MSRIARSRIRSAAGAATSAVAAVNRRTLLTAAGGTGAAVGLGLAFGPHSGSATASPSPAPPAPGVE